MSLRTELENYFDNAVYPFVKNTMKQNIAKLLNDATLYDELPNDISDKKSEELLNDILSRLQRIKTANDKFSNIFNGLKP